METEIEETNLILMGREEGKQNRNTKTRQQNEMRWERRVEAEAEHGADPPHLQPQVHSTAWGCSHGGDGAPLCRVLTWGGESELGMRAVRNGRRRHGRGGARNGTRLRWDAMAKWGGRRRRIKTKASYPRLHTEGWMAAQHRAPQPRLRPTALTFQRLVAVGNQLVVRADVEDVNEHLGDCNENGGVRGLQGSWGGGGSRGSVCMWSQQHSSSRTEQHRGNGREKLSAVIMRAAPPCLHGA